MPAQYVSNQENETVLGSVSGEESSMTMQKKCLMALVLVSVSLVLGTSAHAQTIKTGRTVFDNLGGSFASERVPGAMVDAGYSRVGTSADAARGQVHSPNITETEPPTTIRNQFVVEAVQTILDQLFNTINFLGNRLLARTGLMPLLPPEIFFPEADSNTGANGSGDSATDSGDSTDSGDRSRNDRT